MTSSQRGTAAAAADADADADTDADTDADADADADADTDAADCRDAFWDGHEGMATKTHATENGETGPERRDERGCGGDDGGGDDNAVGERRRGRRSTAHGRRIWR